MSLKRPRIHAFLCSMLLASGVASADGDAVEGEKVFRRCMACHTMEEGSKGKIGPDLLGVVGRPAGTASGFDRYSEALASSGIVWSEDTLTQWLQGPAELVPGTKMGFRLSSPEDIADVIAYLKANSPAAD